MVLLVVVVLVPLVLLVLLLEVLVFSGGSSWSGGFGGSGVEEVFCRGLCVPGYSRPRLGVLERWRGSEVLGAGPSLAGP